MINNLSVLLSVAEDTRGLGEKMSEAGLNTLIGISIVFFALAFISIIILLEGKIFIKIGKKAKKKEADEVTAQPAATTAVEEKSDDALIAVITAAVYEYELQTTGTVPANGLFVRSIRRRA